MFRYCGGTLNCRNNEANQQTVIRYLLLTRYNMRHDIYSDGYCFVAVHTFPSSWKCFSTQ